MRVSDGAMQDAALGRLPANVASANPPETPDPEYIPEAEVPGEDVWEREQARYRQKNARRPADS